jgi:hypothetical protein
VTSFLISIAVLILTFASGITVLFLQKLLPEHHTSDRSRDNRSCCWPSRLVKKYRVWL